MNEISIRQLEELSQIRAHTIRIWENRYGLFKPGRSSGNIRYYSVDDLKKLLDIAFLNRAGEKDHHWDRATVSLNQRIKKHTAFSAGRGTF